MKVSELKDKIADMNVGVVAAVLAALFLLWRSR
jgi:hypothetical protein